MENEISKSILTEAEKSYVLSIQKKLNDTRQLIYGIFLFSELIMAGLMVLFWLDGKGIGQLIAFFGLPLLVFEIFRRVNKYQPKEEVALHKEVKKGLLEVKIIEKLSMRFGPPFYYRREAIDYIDKDLSLIPSTWKNNNFITYNESVKCEGVYIPLNGTLKTHYKSNQIFVVTRLNQYSIETEKAISYKPVKLKFMVLLLLAFILSIPSSVLYIAETNSKYGSISNFAELVIYQPLQYSDINSLIEDGPQLNRRVQISEMDIGYYEKSVSMSKYRTIPGKSVNGLVIELQALQKSWHIKEQEYLTFKKLTRENLNTEMIDKTLPVLSLNPNFRSVLNDIENNLVDSDLQKKLKFYLLYDEYENFNKEIDALFGYEVNTSFRISGLDRYLAIGYMLKEDVLSGEVSERYQKIIDDIHFISTHNKVGAVTRLADPSARYSYDRYLTINVDARYSYPTLGIWLFIGLTLVIIIVTTVVYLPAAYLRYRHYFYQIQSIYAKSGC
ncbi:hypothetical protein [Reinekea thalattae]|uniref:Uncharacterized protein n=1 Tax=Reinekea thalattae TaxID=2593301 RepID=A0A5C8YZW9_9GAMM|nr:hypothetical protein [Reinekea thalattae]TXR51415.1 hypothetical protein FME95_12885 [Reinekea thalattae]